MAMTVRLPDELVRAAKEFGAQRGVHSVNALIAIALREYLVSRGIVLRSEQLVRVPSQAETLRGERPAHAGFPMQRLAEATARAVMAGPVKSKRRGKKR